MRKADSSTGTFLRFVSALFIELLFPEVASGPGVAISISLARLVRHL